MNRLEEKKILDQHASTTSRLMTKTLPIIKKTYGDIQLIDLLMGLPITFELKEVDVSKIPAKQSGKVTIKDLAIGGYIMRDTERGNPDRMVVFITFTKDTNQTWDEYFNMLLNDPYFHNSIAFTYIHEAMHILMRHYDFYMNSNFERIITDIRDDLDTSKLLNYAYDYWNNAYLLEQAQSGTKFNDWSRNQEDFPYLYDPNLSPKNMTLVEVIVKLTKEADIKKSEVLDTDGNHIGDFTEITINGNVSSSFSPTLQHGVTQAEIPEAAEQSVSDILDSAKNSLIEKTRGEGSQGAFTKLGIDYAVPTDWFKALKGSVFSVAQRHTNRYDNTWSRLRNKMRHIAPLPGRIYYEKNLAAVISIDQSGSMSDEDLEKINYVVSKLAKQTIFTEVLLHDTKIAEHKRFKGKSFESIRDFITNRVACGGTSHKEVFAHLADLKAQEPKLKFIYLSFSDNWSDIDQVYNQETFMGINAYWITTDENRTVNVPGMQISLENGLLTT